jgi:hypothetical protein
MNARYAFHALALVLPFGLFAQQAQRCCGTSNSTFLLGNTNFAPHTQSLYLPGDLVNEESGLITTLYFRYGDTGEDLGNTLSGLLIRLGMTSAGSIRRECVLHGPGHGAPGLVLFDPPRSGG